tara:strand:- start:512 stop:1069 length:558 start_codon:yes stop_codon:yes gene_type:complete
MINFNRRLLETLKINLLKHHHLYKQIRCKAEYLEELLTMSLKSDNYEIEWKPASHDKKKDLIVNGENLSVKSGVLKPHKNEILISGHRLTRFKHDFDKITDYLNSSTETLCIYNPDERSENPKYSIALIKKEKFSGLNRTEWLSNGKNFTQTNHFDVKFKIQKSMSDQVWWQVPTSQLEIDKEII